ncbi:MAG: hypothetical protein ABI640_17905 [Gammaproteobacteria bacterium]
MIDDDMRRLDEGERNHSLNRLESDIWTGVDARARQRAAARRIVSFQGAIMIVALLGSAAAGLSTVRPADGMAGAGLIASGVELMPSSLLLGEHL